MKNIILATIISMLLTGCAGLPKNSNDAGILYIPIERDYKPGDTPYVKYRIVYSNGDRAFYITPTKDFSLVKNLTPGNYYVERIQPVYIHSGKMYRSSNARSFSFEIKPGHITVLSKKLYVRFLNYEDGTRRQRGEFKYITNDDMVKIQFNIKNLKGIEYWQTGDL